MPMREIIASVRDGRRDASVLVWWSGATDWIRFDSDGDLLALSQEQVADLPVVDDAESAPSVFEPAALTPAHASPEPDVFEPQAAVEPDPEPAVFAPQATHEPVAEPTALESAPAAYEPEVVAEPQATTEQVVQPASFEPAATSQPAPHEPARQSFAMATDDDGWSVIPDLADPLPAAQAPVQETVIPDAAAPLAQAPQAAPAPLGDDAFSFNLPTREAGEPTESMKGKPAITGLFSSGARTDADGTEAPTPSPDALDAILAARSSLESVGARIEALSSATKASLTPEQIQTGMDDIEQAPAVEQPVHEVAVATQAPAADAPAGSWTSVESEAAAQDATMTSTVDQSAARAELTARFNEMVEKSDEHQRRIEWVTRVDELLLSACITAIADSGFVAIDLDSRESDHTVLFNHNDDSRKVRLRLAPLETVSARLGRHVTFGLAWGRDVSDPDRAFEIVRQNTDDAPIPPGVITPEADMASSSVSTQVSLILAADDFVKDNYSVDRPLLDSAIAAALHALEGHWHTLFDSVQ